MIIILHQASQSLPNPNNMNISKWVDLINVMFISCVCLDEEHIWTNNGEYMYHNHNTHDKYLYSELHSTLLTLQWSLSGLYT